MALEIEAKMRVADLPAIQERLARLGATFVGDALETNAFFDTPDRALRAGDRGLRVRTAVTHQSGAVVATITYKGPRQPGPLKSREEHETTVGDPAAAAAIVAALGFAPVLSFEKRRQSWDLHGCRIELDELPYLGSFVEVEGPDDAVVLRVRDELGLTGAPMLTSSYIAMLTAHLEQHGLATSAVTFASAAAGHGRTAAVPHALLQE